MIQSSFLDEWQQEVPWTNRLQVEQDLVISRAIVELFSNDLLAQKLAFRGGTALNKLFMKEATRYSEDIDLVQITQEKIGETIDTIRALLDPWLGKPARDRGQARVTLNYRFSSERETPLRLKIEINSGEHYHLFGFKKLPYSVASGWFHGSCNVTTYSLEELLGTKIRALYQRKKGRDLFDLWYAFTHLEVDKKKTFEAFKFYLEKENNFVSKNEFLQNLHNKKSDHDFASDIWPIKSENIVYDFDAAFDFVSSCIQDHL